MAAEDHQDVNNASVTTIDLSAATATARGVNGPSGAHICSVYTPSGASCFWQTGAQIVDGADNISDAGPLVPGAWVVIPCRLADAPGPESGRPTVYFQGDADLKVRFTAGGMS